jgi:beta-N-acetylhexosaminidase
VRLREKALVSTALLGAVVTGCGTGSRDAGGSGSFSAEPGNGFPSAPASGPATTGPGSTSAAPTDTAPLSPQEQRVRAVLDRMSVEDKVGQLFVTYVYGSSASDPAYRAKNLAAYGVASARQVVDRYRLGGVIYFDWAGNLGAPPQVAALSNGLQHAAMSHHPAVPLLVSVDQEGGTVTRLGAPVVSPPGNMAVAATFRVADARATAQVTGEQLRALGINTDDAPVVDVNAGPANRVDGTRSFGDRPAAVGQLAAAAVRGFTAAGVAATVKHFPGLGSTTTNTDDAPASTDRSRSGLLDIDVPPFQQAIAAGAQLVMTGHVVARALDPSATPASLSAPVVTGLLRDTLGYDGVVTTDSLAAGALSGIPPALRAVRAIEAGNDIALMPASLTEAVAAVLRAVRYGAISAARLDESVSRIIRLKLRLGLFEHPYVPADPVIGTRAQAATMSDVASRAVTLLRNAGSVLPLKAGGRCVALTGSGPLGALATRLASLHPSVIATGRHPPSQLIGKAVATARGCGRVLVTTTDASADPGQRRLVAALVGTGRPVVAAALAGPYDAADLGAPAAVLATYSTSTASIDALAEVLLGAAEPTGRLPVTVSASYPYGYGLHY